MRSRGGFSLVEVVVAIGVFVAGVLGALALMSSSADNASRALELNGAVRAGESGAVWLRSLTWDEALAQIDGTPIFANMAGEISPWDNVPESDARFEMAVTRNPELSPETNDNEAGFLALRLTITWPVWQSPTLKTDPTTREQLTFNVGVRR